VGLHRRKLKWAVRWVFLGDIPCSRIEDGRRGGGRRPGSVRGPGRPHRPSSPSLTGRVANAELGAIRYRYAPPLPSSRQKVSKVARVDRRQHKATSKPNKTVLPLISTPSFRRKGKLSFSHFLLFSNHLFLFIHYRSGAARPSVRPCSTYAALLVLDD
jgi:hypothetical protein